MKEYRKNILRGEIEILGIYYNLFGLRDVGLDLGDLLATVDLC